MCRIFVINLIAVSPAHSASSLMTRSLVVFIASCLVISKILFALLKWHRYRNRRCVFVSFLWGLLMWNRKKKRKNLDILFHFSSKSNKHSSSACFWVIKMSNLIKSRRAFNKSWENWRTWTRSWVVKTSHDIKSLKITHILHNFSKEKKLSRFQFFFNPINSQSFQAFSLSSSVPLQSSSSRKKIKALMTRTRAESEFNSFHISNTQAEQQQLVFSWESKLLFDWIMWTWWENILYFYHQQELEQPLKVSETWNSFI